MGLRISASLLARPRRASAGRDRTSSPDGTSTRVSEAWHHDPNTRGTSAWSPVLDANGSASSGSALLFSTAPEGGVLVELLDQCVPVAAGQQYVLSHKVRFADDETTTGWAESVVSWFSGPICTNGISANGMLTEKTASGVWTSTSETFTAPAGAISALVTVGVDKIEAGGQLTVNVDDVVFGLGLGARRVAGRPPRRRGLAARQLRLVLPDVAPDPEPLFNADLGPLRLPSRRSFASPSDPTMGYALAPGQSFALVRRRRGHGSGRARAASTSGRRAARRSS